MHDPGVDRTTDGAGLVRDLSLADIRALRITGGDQGAVVPTLREALDLASGRAAVDLEIKNIPGEPDFKANEEQAVAAVHRALAEAAFVGDVIVSSFNPLSIAASRAIDPTVPTGLLTEYGVDAATALAFAADEGHDWVLPFTHRVLEAGPAFPEAAHRAGLLLGTWITDDPVEAMQLFAAGVDAVATNDPRAMVAARREAYGA
jgi:glycerophosphoryl diester phosphodiesterase